MRLLGSTLAAITAVLMIAGPTWAAATGGDGPGGTISVGASDGSSSAGAPGAPAGSGASGTPGSGAGGGRNSVGGSPWVCTYTSLVLNDEGGFAPGGPTPGGWYSVTCANRVTGASTTQTEWIAQGSPATPATPTAPVTPAIDPRVVAVQAENALILPSPSLHFNPAGSSIVNFPTWLWIDGAIWHSYSVTASAGTVSATAVATPQSVAWEMGDGSLVVCPGPGQPFDMALPARQQRTGCDYTYRATSLGQPAADGDANDAAYPVRASVTWAVSWWAVGAPGQGALPPLVTTGQTTVRVVQVESIDSGLFGASRLTLSSPVRPTTAGVPT